MSSSSHAGRPKSWAAVLVIFVGFVVGGAAMVLGMNWPMFWAGAGIVAAGGVLALAVGIMGDVVLDDKHL
ncbi:HGxxPAAW family protein [Actinomadura macrotermitis]|uniref:Uncharacterized protein n=1 Tax=Actinomadura macrotermitis TaxID=2585200 RepID=A0A7K0C6T0_9ACTN|nr:HGxxPAAW family protein [Actinomadura macrotermitis]MQY09167.1 hypothetical protein [Actinomadura macrotermitis]